MNAETAAAPLLEIEGLRVDFHLKAGTLTAVDGLSLEIRPGETLGIVGETGSGKSVTALSILGLIPSPPGQIAAGRILFEGADLLRKSRADLRRIRGRQISMIFQEPMTSLNPSIAVGEQIAECYRTHMGHSKRIAAEFTAEILRAVRVPSPREMMRRYPHELSGGMRQRVMIAMALSCEPKLLIADEPTTALDVTIQAQILELLMELQQRFRMALIFISHNLAVVSRLCDRIGVMYAGRLVELASRQALFDRPRHPYTVGLLDAFPRPDARDAELKTIPGSICNLLTPPPGCKFHPRCRKARGVCREQPPPLAAAAGGAVACYFPED